jgi:hypothetical protein
MIVKTLPIGTVISDRDTPTFETVRIKLKAGQDVKPGMLVRIPVSRSEKTMLYGRIRSAYESNSNESAESINVTESMGLPRNYPKEEDSTRIFRIAEADLIEEIIDTEIRAPQNLPNSGAEVFIADSNQTVRVLGMETDQSKGLYIGETVSGTKTEIILKREAIQRHFFIGGT